MSKVLVFFAVIFAILPSIVVLLASLTAGQALSFPPQGLSLRWYAALAQHPGFTDALIVSISVATVTSVAAILLSVPAAIAIVRFRIPGSTLIESFLLSPLAVPNIILGIGILQIYTFLWLRSGLVTVTLAHLIVTVPLALRMIISALQGLDARVEDAAQSLGAPPGKVLFTIILPQIKVAILGAAIVVFILSFDDVTLTAFLVQPGYTTLPLMLLSQAENNPDPMIHAASVVLLLMSWIAVFAIDRTIGFERFAFGARKV